MKGVLTKMTAEGTLFAYDKCFERTDDYGGADDVDDDDDREADVKFLQELCGIDTFNFAAFVPTNMEH